MAPVTYEERIVPVKSWLRPSTFRALRTEAGRRGFADVGELLSRVAEQLTAPPAPAKPSREPKYSSTELEQRRAERWAAFAADLTDTRHGTLNGYTNLRCRCPRCRKAAADHAASRRTR